MKRKIFIFALWLGLSSSLLLSFDAQKFPFKLEVVTEQANIREKPDIGSTIISQVPRGTILESTKKAGEWYLVRLKVEEDRLLLGYVHESLVLRIEPEVEKPELIEEEKIVEEKEILEEEEEKPEVEKKMPEEKVEEPEEEKIQIAPPPTVTPVVVEPLEKKFMLSIFGGGNYISGGDLNEGARGFAEFSRDDLKIQGEAALLHLSYIFGAELSFPLSSQFYLGIGADYFRGKKESSSDQTETLPGNSFATRPEIEALPLRVVLSFYPVPFLYLKGGVEYYFAKISYFYRFQEGDYRREWEGNANSQGLGILGALGLDWSISSYFSLFAEATGRYAKIKGFEGEDTSRDSEGFIYTEEGTLYFYQVSGTNQKTYPQLFIRNKKPAEARVSDAREALVDFSSVSLRLGFRIKF